LAEAGTLHRNEPSGTLHGLLRVRHVTQDDGHVFCLPDQIEDEVGLCLEHAFYIYRLLDLPLRVELSLRPENKLGSDEDWDAAEDALRNALQHREIEFQEMPGEGAFYGPKIDMHIDDTVGKRIREAELEKIPYTIVYGDRESDDSLAIRERHGAQSTKSLDELLKELARL